MLLLFLFLLNFSDILVADEQINKNTKCIQAWTEKGITFICPNFVVIDTDVEIGKNTIIGAGVHLLKGTHVGANCTIEAFSVIENCTIEDNAYIYSHSVLQDSTVKKNAKVGPFARIRNHSMIHSEAEIGNFVELSSSVIGEKSKAKHLTYLGYAEVQERVNIGAGTITCNYDGYKKHKTIFKCNSFIGSNNTFIAPIEVGENAITAAGSVFTDNIPDNAFAIARSYQTNKEDYALKLRKKLQSKVSTKY